MGKELPNNWIAVSLEDSCDILDSQRIPVSANERAKRTGNIPYYGATGQAGTIDDYIFDEELVLIGEDGAPFFDKKKNVAYLIQGKSWVNNHAHVLRGKNKILENKLLLHYLNHFNYEDYVGGTTRLKLTQQNLKKIPILLPPFPEQNRIVDKLDAIFGHLEQLKTKLDKIPGLLKNFRQALLNQAVTGKLTEEWREGKELEDMELILPEIRKGLIRELKNQNKRIKTNDSPLDGDLPKISKSWTWARLLDFSDVIGGVTKGRKLKDKKTVFVPYLRVANVQDGYLDLEEIKEIEVLPTDIKKYELKEKDILFTEGGDRDKLGRGTIWQNQIQGCIHQNHVYRARIYSNQIIPEYVSYFTKGIVAKTYFFENANQTVNLASINLTTLSNVPIAIPPTAEQQKIVENIKSLFNKADKIEQQYQTLKEKIDQLPQAILAKAFKGELVEQVPTDGDAKELLKQIQKAKAELGKTGKTKPKRGNTRKIPDIEERMAAEPKGRYRK